MLSKSPTKPTKKQESKNSKTELFIMIPDNHKVTKPEVFVPVRIETLASDKQQLKDIHVPMHS